MTNRRRNYDPIPRAAKGVEYFYAFLVSGGIVLRPEGDIIHVDGPEDRVSPLLLAEIEKRKPGLLEILRKNNMQTTPVSAGVDTLLILAPPVRLVVWLEKVFEAKRKKGEVVPEQFERWMDRWQKIRSHLPSEIDVLTPAEWQEIHNKVKET